MSSVDLLGSQSGHSGGREISTSASRRNQGNGDRANFYDGSNVRNDRSREAQAANRVESTPLKVKLISGSHGISNLLVMKAILLRTL